MSVNNTKLWIFFSAVFLTCVPYACSVTRVYWSTVDPRRRCTYTLRIVLVTPTPDIPDAKLCGAGLTVAHDPAHPQYDHDLHVKYSSGKKPGKKLDNAAVSADGSATLSEEGTESLTDHDSHQFHVDALTGLPNKTSLQSSHHTVSSASSTSTQGDCTGKTVNLSALSSTTLKMLNISDPTKYVPRTMTQTDDIADDLCLGTIAQRLNNAAKSSRKRKSSSEENDSDRKEGENFPLGILKH